MSEAAIDRKVDEIGSDKDFHGTCPLNIVPLVGAQGCLLKYSEHRACCL